MVWDQLQKILDLDRLKIVAGRIEGWTRQPTGPMTVTVKTRGGGGRQNRTVDCVINCTGGTSDSTSTLDQLMVNLKARGVVDPHPIGVGIRSSSDGYVVGRDGGKVPWLFVLGALRGGDLGETTAVPELRVQAHDIARQVLDHWV